MQIGSLNKTISIEAPTKASDGMGGTTNSWKEMASDIPAAIWPTSATEQIKSMGETMIISHRIRIRHRKDIRPNWRLKYKDSYYNIVSIINNNMDNRILDILAKEAA